jgi:hypothetical protein
MNLRNLEKSEMLQDEMKNITEALIKIAQKYNDGNISELASRVGNLAANENFFE